MDSSINSAMILSAIFGQSNSRPAEVER